MLTHRDIVIGKIKAYSDFAHGYANQAMLDRDNAIIERDEIKRFYYLESAIHCQLKAAAYYVEVQCYKELLSLDFDAMVS